jgi:TRAP-type transport system periplasmic protein
MQRRASPRGAGKAVIAAAAAIVIAGLAPAVASAQQFTMKIGTPTIRGQLEEWGRLIGEGIEKRTAGKMKVQVFPGSQLGSIPRMVEGAQLGTIETVQVPPEFLSGIDERFAIFSAPAVMTGLWQGTHALNDPEFKKEFWQVGADKGIKIVGHNCDAPSDYATRNPIHKMDDFKGLKLRVFGSPLEREALSRLGATGVPMPLGEVLPAIQRRTIDGNKSGITVFVPFKYYDTVKYVFKARESMICVLKFLSKQWYDKLPGDMQTVVTEEALKADKDVMPFTIDIVNNSYKAWTEHGGTLTEFDAAEQAAFYARLKTVGPTVFKDKPKATALLALLTKVAAKYKDTPSGM